MFTPLKQKRIYLDYASATPVRREVVKAMEPFWNQQFGNPSAVHREGVVARNAVEQAREELARALHVRPAGVVYTGSGTESNNIAIFGTVEALVSNGVPYSEMEIISTAIEHASVMEVLAHLEKRGVTVKRVAVDQLGIIQIEDLKKQITPKTVLVTFAYANSEIGVVQHVGKIARVIREQEKKFNTHIYVHIDAAQAPLWLPCDLDRLSVDMLSLDAGKCYGPKGIGVLVFRHGVTLAPHLYGGHQEGGLRPGTENTALIVGGTKALVLAQQDYEDRSSRIQKLRDMCIANLELIEGIELNGSKTDRIANNVNISIPGIDAEFAVISLDEAGIACSTKSACGGAGGDGSAVVRTITGDEVKASSTIRLTLGEETTEQDILYTIRALADHITKMRSFGTTLIA